MNRGDITGILYGLAAALCWGTSDFLATRATRTIGVLQTAFYIQLIGMIVLGTFLLLWTDMPTVSPAIWGLAVVVSLVNMAGTLLLYRAFTIGILALVAPIAASSAAVAMLLALLSGERPTTVGLIGGVLVVIGVVTLSRVRNPSGTVSLAGVPEALGVSVCFGTYFWSVNFVTPEMGVLWPVLVVRAVEMVGALLLLLLLGSRPAGMSKNLWPVVAVASILNTMAFVAYNLGISQAVTAIVAPLASLASGVTVLLAWLFLRDRLSRLQWVGVVIILIGVVLVSV
jgi:drug/metabolite transporter (DMT)-like permease